MLETLCVSRSQARSASEVQAKRPKLSRCAPENDLGKLTLTTVTRICALMRRENGSKAHIRSLSRHLDENNDDIGTDLRQLVVYLLLFLFLVTGEGDELLLLVLLSLAPGHCEIRLQTVSIGKIRLFEGTRGCFLMADGWERAREGRERRGERLGGRGFFGGDGRAKAGSSSEEVRTPSPQMRRNESEGVEGGCWVRGRAGAVLCCCGEEGSGELQQLPQWETDCLRVTFGELAPQVSVCSDGGQDGGMRCTEVFLAWGGLRRRAGPGPLSGTCCSPFAIPLQSGSSKWSAGEEARTWSWHPDLVAGLCGTASWLSRSSILSRESHRRTSSRGMTGNHVEAEERSERFNFAPRKRSIPLILVLL